MNFRNVFRAVAVAGVLGLCSRVSQAQCANAQINQAFAANHSTPSAAECDANRYGAGSWSGQADLNVRVAKARLCSDPWVGQIYWNLYNRNPTAAECSQNYGNRSSYMALAGAIQASKTAPPAGAYSGVTINLQNNTLNDHGTVVPLSEVQLIGQDGGGLTPAQAAALVAAGGGNLVAAGGGNLKGYSVQSVGSKKVYQLKR